MHNQLPMPSIEIPTQIHLALNRVLSQYCRFQLVQKNSEYNIQNTTALILQNQAMVQLNNQSILQIKIFDKYMSTIINQVSIDNIKNLRSLNIMINRQQQQVIIVCIHPTAHKHQKHLKLYGSNIGEQIVARISAKFTCPQNILKVSDSYHLNTRKEYFWVITTEYGRIFLLSYNYNEKDSKVNLIDITEQSAWNSLFKTVMRPFLPPKNPYSSCKIFFYPYQEKSNLYTFILFDFWLQMRFLSLNDIYQISKTPQWELNLSTILPRSVKQIMYAQLKALDPKSPQYVTFFFVCYEQDNYNSDNNSINLYLIKVQINSKQHQLQSHKNILQLSKTGINRVSFKSKQNKLWILHCHQQDNSNHRKYRLSCVQINEENQSEKIQVSDSINLKQKAILLGFEQYGICLLSQTNLYQLDSQTSEDSINMEAENSQPLNFGDNLQNQIDEQKHRNNNNSNKEQIEHIPYSKNSVKILKDGNDSRYRTDKITRNTENAGKNKRNTTIYKAIVNRKIQFLIRQLNQEQQAELQRLKTAFINNDNNNAVQNKQKQKFMVLALLCCILSDQNLPPNTIFQDFGTFCRQTIQNQSYSQQKIQIYQNEQALQHLLIQKQTRLMVILLDLLFEQSEFYILCNMYTKFSEIVKFLKIDKNNQQMCRFIKYNFTSPFYKVLQKCNQGEVEVQMIKQQILYSFLQTYKFIGQTGQQYEMLSTNIYQKYNKDVLIKMATQLREQQLFQYLLFGHNQHKNLQPSMIQQAQFVHFIDMCFDDDNDIDAVINFIKRCVFRQIQTQQSPMILAWINSSKYKQLYFDKMLLYLLQVKPKLAPVYALLAQKPQAMHKIRRLQPRIEKIYSQSSVVGASLSVLINRM